MKNGSTETKIITVDSAVKESGRDRIGNIAIIGILSAISYILMWLEVPAPLMPPFIKFDFSDFPALLAAFGLGPIAGILVELIKNVLHSFSSGSVQLYSWSELRWCGRTCLSEKEKQKGSRTCFPSWRHDHGPHFLPFQPFCGIPLLL